MVSLDIRLQAMEHVKSFVNLANRYPFHIVLRQGRYSVDAKSILGIFSLDRTQPITVDIYSDHCHEFLEAVQRYDA